ncbi:MAG: HepT-like ribonuclease domain-containing protein [Sphingomonas sp.]
MAALPDTLDDLALLIARAEQSVHGRTFDQLVANDEAYDALTYRLAMIGETSKKLPDDLKGRHPHLPWREMATFRNFASHDYFGVDAHLVWQAAMRLAPIRDMVIEEQARCRKQGSEP